MNTFLFRFLICFLVVWCILWIISCVLVVRKMIKDHYSASRVINWMWLVLLTWGIIFPFILAEPSK